LVDFFSSTSINQLVQEDRYDQFVPILVELTQTKDDGLKTIELKQFVRKLHQAYLVYQERYEQNKLTKEEFIRAQRFDRILQKTFSNEYPKSRNKPNKKCV